MLLMLLMLFNAMLFMLLMLYDACLLTVFFQLESKLSRRSPCLTTQNTLYVMEED
jgi:hypothetical protein